MNRIEFFKGFGLPLVVFQLDMFFYFKYTIASESKFYSPHFI